MTGRKRRADGWDVAALVEPAIGAQRIVPKALGATGDMHATGDDLAAWSCPIEVPLGAQVGDSIPVCVRLWCCWGRV
jgi:hypothetical protein